MKKISLSLKKCLLQLFGMIAVIVAVMVVFKTIEPVRVAALVAGSLFLVTSLALIYSEEKWGRKSRSLALWTSVLFLAVFVVPIFGIRILFWEQDFKELTIFSVRAQALHELSSRCYLLLMGMVIYEGLRPHLPGRKLKGPSAFKN